MDSWAGILTNLGLGGGMILAIGFALWQSAKWAAKELLIPARDRFLVRLERFFDRLESHLGKIEQSMDTNLAKIESAILRMEKSIEQVAVRIENNQAICIAHSDRLKLIQEKLADPEK